MEAIYKELSTDPNGLSAMEAEKRLDEFGANIITPEKEKGVLSKIIRARINPFNVVLFLVAVITFITDAAITNNHDYTTSIIILALILISSTIAFVQAEFVNPKISKNALTIRKIACIYFVKTCQISKHF